jgi:hypothetical protein
MAEHAANGTGEYLLPEPGYEEFDSTVKAAYDEVKHPGKAAPNRQPELTVVALSLGSKNVRTVSSCHTAY